ncbi:RNA-directed DNA polymerase, eukaryota [Tanacetum coccineum]
MGLAFRISRRILIVSVREVHKLKGKGFDFWSHCKKHIGNGNDTRFWFDCWIGDIPLRDKFPRLFALELDKEASMAVKLSTPIENSFRRSARGGLEQHLLADMNSMLDSVALLNSGDRWVCDLASDGNFRVKDVHNSIDDLFLPCQAVPTRWVKYILLCVYIYSLGELGRTLVLRRICRWWDLDPHGWSSFQEWQSWLLSIRLSSKSVSIIHETTALYTPQQNGISERENRVLKQMVNFMLSYSGLSQGFWGETIAVVRLPDPKLKTLGEKDIKCIFVGYVEHSKAFRLYVIEPNESVLINSIIELRDAIFDENRFSSVSRPSQRYLINGSEDIVVQWSQKWSLKRLWFNNLNLSLKSKRNRTLKNFAPEF